MIVNDPELRNKLIHSFHEEPVGGHSGTLATYKCLATIVCWKGMREIIKQFFQNCDVCQLNKTDTSRLVGLLHPLPVPQRLWDDIAMDFIEGLPSARGKSVIFVVVDRFSKVAHFMAISHPYTAAKVAQVFLDNIYKLHGMPSSIVSDRDPVFTSIFWK